MILIGSRALYARNANAIKRKPLDFDFMVESEQYAFDWIEKNKTKIKPNKIYQIGNKVICEGEAICEFEVTNTESGKMFYDLVINDNDTINTKFGMIPNFDLLFTLKASHRYLKNSPHFWKTAVDYHVMKSFGAKIRDEYKDFFKTREKETYNYLHPKLNQSKNDFFNDDKIKYVYDHDSIHESIKLYDKPAYLYYLKDGEQVQCDKVKFFNCSDEIKLAGVIEESAVLAIERSLVPHPNVKSPKEAWVFALSKVCTSITSGWFREFAFENVFKVLNKYPEGYWSIFQEDLLKNKIKPFSGSKY